jgi:hypothetical protein
MLFSACGRTTPKSGSAPAPQAIAAQQTAKSAPLASSVESDDAGTAPAAEASVQPYAELPRWYNRFDPLKWFVVVEQKAPKGYQGILQQIDHTPFPGKPVARIRAFERGLGESARSMRLDCEFLTAAGTVCPNVLFPGKTLSQAQQTRLLAVFGEAKRWMEQPGGHLMSRPRVHCGIEPGVAFILYDKSDSPIGEIQYAEGCQLINLQPMPPDGWDDFVSVTLLEKDTLRALCNELELDTCRDDPVPWSEIYAPTRPRQALPLLLRDAPNIERDRILAQTTPLERRQLCAWVWRGIQTVYRSLPGSSLDGVEAGTEFAERGASRALRLVSIDDCVRKFPVDCARLVSDVVNDLRQTLENLAQARIRIPEQCVFGMLSVTATQENELNRIRFSQEGRTIPRSSD